MKLSTRARYGLRAMLDLASNPGPEPVILRSIARRQETPGRYLENIMTSLVAAGLVRSVRGQKGGFSLARPAAEIRLSQIVQAAEGQLTVARCLEGRHSCNRTEACAIKDVWEGLKGAMLSYLDGITLESLANRQKRLDPA